MKRHRNFFGIFVLLAIMSSVLQAQNTPALPPKNLLKGKMFVSKIKGSPQIITKERIFEAKQSDALDASGARIETDAASEIMLILSNHAFLAIGPNTRIDIRKFEQEFFQSAIKAGTGIEPSMSQTNLHVARGKVVVKTSTLLSGSSFLVTTSHATVNVRTAQVAVSAAPPATDVYLIAGEATVTNRSILTDGGTVLKKGQYAVIKPEAETRKSQSGNLANKVLPDAAVVRKRTGTVFAQLPGQGALGLIAPGTSLPQGTEITTLADGEIYVETIPGAIAAIKANSSVLVEEIVISRSGSAITSQASTLYLKEGQIASIIDPARQSINRYGVRTTKGVAIAQGTGFSVAISRDSFSVVTTADSVSFASATGSTFPIQAGMTSIGGSEAPISLPSAMAANPSLTGIVQSAMDTISTVISSNLGGILADASANLMAQVVTHAISASPDQAANFTTQAVTAVSTVGASTANSSSAAAGVTSAAVGAAPTQAATVASAAATAAPSHAVSIASAATTAAPDQAAAIAGAVTTAVPAQAVAIASAVTTASPAYASVIASSVATAAPAQAVAVASAVTTVAPPQATEIALAVTTAVPAQAVPIAVAVAQEAPSQAAAIGAATTAASPNQAVAIAAALANTEPTQAPAIANLVTTAAGANGNSSQAAAIAAAVAQSAPNQAAAIGAAATMASPSQAVAIASALTQNEPTQASAIAQSVTTAAAANGRVSQAAAIAVAVWQAAPTQVGQIATASISAAPTEALAISFALAQAAPAEAERLYAAAATTTNTTMESVRTASVQQTAAGAAAIQTATTASQNATTSVQTATAVSQTTAASVQVATAASQTAAVATQAATIASQSAAVGAQIAATTSTTITPAPQTSETASLPETPTAPASAPIALGNADSAAIATAAQSIAEAVAAENSVTFEVVTTPTGAPTNDGPGAGTANSNTSEASATGEVVARPVVPAQLPTNIVVSPHQLPGA